MEKGRRILIVDPDANFAREFSAVLAEDDFIVEISQGITDAVSKLKDTKFDCVIMDVNLLDLKGYAAVSIIKAIDQRIAVILTANKNTKELEKKVRSQDIFYYYLKSFDREELRLVVNNVFKKPAQNRYKTNSRVLY